MTTPAPIESLCQSARIRLRKEPTHDQSFKIHLKTIRLLLEMRIEGLLEAVWIDELRDIHVRFPGKEYRHKLSWTQADDLTEAYVKQFRGTRAA